MADDPRITAIALQNSAAFARFHLAPHLRSLFHAVELKIVTSHVLFRNTVGLQIDRDLGCVVVVFDVLDGGTGPSGFDTKLLSDLVAAAVGVIVVTKFETPDPYTEAINAAFQSKSVVLVVETVDSRAGEWLQLSRSARGNLWSLWSGEVGGTA